MIEHRCPKCGAILRLEDRHAGQVVTCAHCGQPGEVAAAAAHAIIDVSARPIGSSEADSDAGSAARPDAGEEPFRHVRYFRVDRGGDFGSGCCGIGCLGLLLFVFLAIRGCLTLF